MIALSLPREGRRVTDASLALATDGGCCTVAAVRRGVSGVARRLLGFRCLVAVWGLRVKVEQPELGWGREVSWGLAGAKDEFERLQPSVWGEEDDLHGGFALACVGFHREQGAPLEACWPRVGGINGGVHGGAPAVAASSDEEMLRLDSVRLDTWEGSLGQQHPYEFDLSGCRRPRVHSFLGCHARAWPSVRRV